jgi:hypothetical protein
MAQLDAKPTQAADDDRPIWGAVAIGKIINRTPAQVYHLTEQGAIDVSKAGFRLLVSTKRRLLRSLGNE